MRSSSSSHANSRLLLRPAARARQGRYRSADTGALSSPAGLARQRWNERLRRALGERAFVVHYQPIVALQDGSVTHYEALVRMHDGVGRPLIAPNRFLPAAERSGLVRDIDALVLERVAALLSRGSLGDGVQVAINLSALSVSDRMTLARIENCLRRHQLDPRRLVFELTETAAISDMRCARSFCAGVRNLGCAVALDDFGTGFGSLQHLKRLPFDYLKIDGAFVSALPRSREDQLIVQALALLARGMGKQTIAEWVGDRETLELLAQFEIDFAQGFQIGRPRPAAALPSRLAADTG